MKKVFIIYISLMLLLIIYCCVGIMLKLPFDNYGYFVFPIACIFTAIFIGISLFKK